MQTYFDLLTLLSCIYRYYNSNQMNHLAYIPTKIDKQRIYSEIALQQANKKEEKEENIPSVSPEPINHRKLGKEELAQLLQRLANNTKKEYNTQQQKTHILTANLQLKKKRAQGEKVQNRLIDYGKKIEEKKVEMSKELEAEMREKYFREVPQISNKAKNLNQRTIDKRLDELIQRRLSKREELQEKYSPSFQPQINPQSEFINQLENYGDLHNRMQIREKEAIKRKELLLKDIQQKKKQQYTFKPVINDNSKNIAENLTTRRPLSVATPKTKKSIVHQVDSEIYPFAPTINKNTEDLLSKKGVESDCFKRLYNNAKDMLQKQQDKIQQRNRAYSFQPMLNNHSLKLAQLPKKQRQETINDFSDKSQEDYQQIKIGNGDDFPRTKSYSVRNEPSKHSHNVATSRVKQTLHNKKALFHLLR